MVEVKLWVDMACSGCSGAVERILKKMEGVESFKVDLETKEVVVIGNVKPEDVVEKVSKTGKETKLVSSQ